jgi:hypothetical protein
MHRNNIFVIGKNVKTRLEMSNFEPNSRWRPFLNNFFSKKRVFGDRWRIRGSKGRFEYEILWL